MTLTILSILASLLTAFILWYKNSEKREKTATWAKFKQLEADLRQAMVDKDPTKVATIIRELVEMREKYDFLEKGDKTNA